jgi:hypothetical protein
MRAVVGLLLILSLVGCAQGSQQPSGPEGSPSSPAGSQSATELPGSESSSPQNPSGGAQGHEAHTLVPILVGYPKMVAIRRVQQRGLRVELHSRRVPCVPVNTVLSQRPRPASRAIAGSVVELTVAAHSFTRSRCNAGVATSEDRHLAAAFYRFAKTPWTGAWDVPIHVGFGDSIVRTLTAAHAGRAQAWRLPPGTVPWLVGRVSPLTQVARSRGRYAVYSGAHPPSCAGVDMQPPPRLDQYHRLSIQPRQSVIDSCLSWWSVNLFVNDVRQVTGVTVNFSEP